MADHLLGELAGKLSGMEARVFSISERIDTLERHLTALQAAKDGRVQEVLSGLRRDLDALRVGELRKLVSLLNSKASKDQVDALEESVSLQSARVDELRMFNVKIVTLLMVFSTIVPLLIGWVWDKLTTQANLPPVTVQSPRTTDEMKPDPNKEGQK